MGAAVAPDAHQVPLHDSHRDSEAPHQSVLDAAELHLQASPAAEYQQQTPSPAAAPDASTATATAHLIMLIRSLDTSPRTLGARPARGARGTIS